MIIEYIKEIGWKLYDVFFGVDEMVSSSIEHIYRSKEDKNLIRKLHSEDFELMKN